MPNNVNYNNLMEEIIEENKKLGIKPKLLVQVCCAPCSTLVLQRLRDYFDIDIYYYNPNIYPESEFDKRVLTLKKLLSETKLPAKIFLGDKDSKAFYEKVPNRKNDKEGGKSCYLCYQLRLDETAKFAKKNSYEYFTTTLSISPYKNSKWLNEIGHNLSQKYEIKYLYADFKKKNGYKKSIDLSKKYDLYRQDYCGCIFSYQEMIEKRKDK